MDSGKRFESRFAASLHALPGASYRIEDGGAIAKNQQCGDFFFFADDGSTWAIECKATNRASFPIANLRLEQMAALARFDALGGNRHALIAINFWGEPLKERNDCLLITWENYKKLHDLALEKERASIPRSWLERFGHLQDATTVKRTRRSESGEERKVSKKIWVLDFRRLLND